MEAAELLTQAVQPKRETGIVKWFNNTYGFIQRRDGKSEVFVHFTGRH